MLTGCPYCGKKEDCPRCSEFPRPKKEATKKANPKKKVVKKK